MNVSRRQARIAALQTLYELDATSHPVTDVLARNLEEPASENIDAEGGVGERLDPEARAFAAELVEGVLAHREELDRIIERSAPNWPIEQMSRIDKTILRLAIFEVLFHNRVPLKAAINEAVELGKRFGSDSSSRFINGVLGTVAQQAQQMSAQGRADTGERARSNGVSGPQAQQESGTQEAG
jgi:N utilization substance protein B